MMWNKKEETTRWPPRGEACCSTSPVGNWQVLSILQLTNSQETILLSSSLQSSPLVALTRRISLSTNRSLEKIKIFPKTERSLIHTDSHWFTLIHVNQNSLNGQQKQMSVVPPPFGFRLVKLLAICCYMLLHDNQFAPRSTKPKFPNSPRRPCIQLIQWGKLDDLWNFMKLGYCT